MLNPKSLASYLDAALSAHNGPVPTEVLVHLDRYVLAMHILITNLGIEWVQTHVMPSYRPQGYFADPRTQTSNLQLRAWELADLLFNLQDTENFGQIVEKIQYEKKRESGIAGAIAELNGGRFFRVHKLPFKFVVPSGEQQSDYDIEFTRTDGLTGYCETKCKLRATELSESTIVNSLKSAKSQLPKAETTGLILLATPHEWIRADFAGLKLIADGIQKFFAKEKTRRVAAVCVFQDDLTLHHSYLIQYYTNPHSPVALGLPSIDSDPMTVLQTCGWHDLADSISAAAPYRSNKFSHR